MDWGLEPHAEQLAVAGLVGGPAAADLAGFCRVFRELPDPDAPFKTPQAATIPDDPSVLYALMASLAARADGKNVKNLMTYLERVPHKEFVVCCMKDMLSRNSKLASHANVTSWLRTEGASLVL